MKILKMSPSKFWFLFFKYGGLAGFFAGVAFTVTVIAGFYIWLYLVPIK